MSRVAKNPIALSKDIHADISVNEIKINGGKGAQIYRLDSQVEVIMKDNSISVLAKCATRAASMAAGTSRANLNNMVIGVSSGFVKKLEIIGVGYRAQVQGKVLNLSLGYSHPIVFNTPDGITIETPSQTEIYVRGADKQKVGQVAANIRNFRPPEPYKGKGIKYSDEVINRKETKKGK
jgi:large subunit ribosomal protein L6